MSRRVDQCAGHVAWWRTGRLALDLCIADSATPLSQQQGPVVPGDPGLVAGLASMKIVAGDSLRPMNDGCRDFVAGVVRALSKDR